MEGDFITPLQTHPNFVDAVATLAGADVTAKFTFHDGAIRNVGDGRVFPIVHMYDRFPELLEDVRRTHCDKAIP